MEGVYPAALMKNIDCKLVQKPHKGNGYIQIFPGLARAKYYEGEKPQSQAAHRLVIIAHKS